jgi:hypothetical protein
MHLLKQNEERVKNEWNLYTISLLQNRLPLLRFFSTSMNKKEEMVWLWQKRTSLRKSESANEEVETIYFGEDTLNTDFS